MRQATQCIGDAAEFLLAQQQAGHNDSERIQNVVHAPARIELGLPGNEQRISEQVVVPERRVQVKAAPQEGPRYFADGVGHFGAAVHEQQVAFEPGSGAPFVVDPVNEKALGHGAHILPNCARGEAPRGDEVVYHVGLVLAGQKSVARPVVGRKGEHVLAALVVYRGGSYCS